MRKRTDTKANFRGRAALTFSLLSLSLSAGAAVTSAHITDSQLMTLIGGGSVFGATGQLGDLMVSDGSPSNTASEPSFNLRSGDFELGLGYSLSEPSSTRDFVWTTGKTETFSVAYDADASKFSYSLGDKTMKYQASQPYGFTDLVVRAYARNTNESFVSDLTLNGQKLGSTFSDGGGADLLRVSGFDWSQSFSVTGKVALGWDGAAKGQDAGFQLQFIQAVPEPSKVAMLAAGIACIAGWARLRKR
jgi:hypothetical protein